MKMPCLHEHLRSTATTRKLVFEWHGGVTVPSKPKKPCAYPGCPALVTGRYCEEHASEHPFCEKCYERGVLVPVEEIHHKKPLSECGTHDRSNLIALCKSCHSQIHAKRGDRWG